MATQTSPAAAVTATRVGPSDYVVNTNRIDRGLRFTAHGETFEVVGDPIAIGWNSASARVREIGGRHDGNEFAAYLRAR